MFKGTDGPVASSRKRLCRRGRDALVLAQRAFEAQGLRVKLGARKIMVYSLTDNFLFELHLKEVFDPKH